MRLKYLLGLGLLTLIGLVNFGQCVNFQGFTKVYTKHFDNTTCTSSSSCPGIPTSDSSSNIYTGTTNGLYCIVLENIVGTYGSNSTSNIFNIGISAYHQSNNLSNSWFRIPYIAFDSSVNHLPKMAFCDTMNGYQYTTSNNILLGDKIYGRFYTSSTSSFYNLLQSVSFDVNIYYSPLDYDLYGSSCPTCQTCDYASYESQIESLSGNLASCSASYNSCITDYGNCSNSLNYCYFDLGDCRAGNCSGSYDSNIFINNIQYPSNTNLFVNIPSEFDYTYNMTGNDSSIDVEYKVDTGYMVGVITNQMTLPNATDLNNLISYLLPLFVPGLVIVLFLYFVFRLLKKIF